MTLEEVKQAIASKACIPEALLSGETVEENIAQAKALLAYRKQHEKQGPVPASVQFESWLRSQVWKESPQDEVSAALADLEESARVEAGVYPTVKDSGEASISDMADPRPAKEQFVEWFENQSAYNPFKGL